MYGSDLGIFDLSLARGGEGAVLVSWAEGSLGRGQPTWMRLGDAQAHRIELPPVAELDSRAFSPVLPLGGEAGAFVWYGFDGFGGAGTLHEILVGADGGLSGYRGEPSPISSPWLGLPVAAISLGRQVALAGIDPSDLIMSIMLVTPGEAYGGVPAKFGQIDLGCPLQIMAAGAAGGGGVAVFANCEEVIAVGVRAGDESAEGMPEDRMPVELGEPVAVAASRAGVAVLTRTGDDHLVVYARAAVEDAGIETVVPGLFDESAWELDTATREARLFASDDRFAVVWNEGDDGHRRTRAVTLRPGRKPGAVFDWPLDDAECAVGSAIPDGADLTYVCVGRCQGDGCAERWIYRGRIDLGS